MSDIFLLGAGFSKAISDEMPLLAELSERIGDSIPELRKHPAWSLSGGNVETLLTYLSEDQPWLSTEDNLRNRSLFFAAARAISEVLDARTEEVRRRQAWPHWLTKLVDRWHERRHGVLTLNYDYIVEAVAALVNGIDDRPGGVECFDIYPVPLMRAEDRTGAVHRLGLTYGSKPPARTFALFKLHGSINWFYSGSPTFAGEPIYYIGIQPLSPEKDFTWKEQVEASEVHDLVPFIVPPLLEKSPYFQHNTVRRLWFLAGEALRAASRVSCLGYSLPATDITMQFFLRANRPEQRVKMYVVNRDRGAATRYDSLLGDVYEIVQFCCEAPIPAFVEKLLGGELDTG